jgi:hypothetical protein
MYLNYVNLLKIYYYFFLLLTILNCKSNLVPDGAVVLNYEFESVWKEEIVTYFKMFLYLPEENNSETTRTFSPVSQRQDLSNIMEY